MAKEEEIVLKEIEFFGDSFVFQETSRKRPHPVGPKEDDQIQEEEKKKKRLENTPEGEVPDDDPIPEDPFQNPPEDSKDEIPEDPIQESC
ncbi:Protein CBG26530 [Caenorhabditis briggsae]|uniref:Protein CBG26530 n=1 Tax=Caenorhabditis briggsae TaxID=6238 RepID=B6IHW1_CAEBR|nr:Protein CBG26530 [Caenorhabditis briggsae]CAR99491.1 Protein CBG26530 [Caenorhabditis briggsae]